MRVRLGDAAEDATHRCLARCQEMVGEAGQRVVLEQQGLRQPGKAGVELVADLHRGQGFQPILLEGVGSAHLRRIELQHLGKHAAQMGQQGLAQTVIAMRRKRGDAWRRRYSARRRRNGDQSSFTLTGLARPPVIARSACDAAIPRVGAACFVASASRNDRGGNDSGGNDSGGNDSGGNDRGAFPAKLELLWRRRSARRRHPGDGRQSHSRDRRLHCIDLVHCNDRGLAGGCGRSRRRRRVVCRRGGGEEHRLAAPARRREIDALNPDEAGLRQPPLPALGVDHRRVRHARCRCSGRFPPTVGQPEDQRAVILRGDQLGHHQQPARAEQAPQLGEHAGDIRGGVQHVRGDHRVERADLLAVGFDTLLDIVDRGGEPWPANPECRQPVVQEAPGQIGIEITRRCGPIQPGENRASRAAGAGANFDRPPTRTGRTAVRGDRGGGGGVVGVGQRIAAIGALDQCGRSTGKQHTERIRRPRQHFGVAVKRGVEQRARSRQPWQILQRRVQRSRDIGQPGRRIDAGSGQADHAVARVSQSVAREHREQRVEQAAMACNDAEPARQTGYRECASGGKC